MWYAGNWNFWCQLTELHERVICGLGEIIKIVSRCANNYSEFLHARDRV